jgi:hypothetical protein
VASDARGEVERPSEWGPSVALPGVLSYDKASPSTTLTTVSYCCDK